MVDHYIKFYVSAGKKISLEEDKVPIGPYWPPLKVSSVKIPTKK